MSDRIWYRNWFNSPYYHVLYKHRDFKEASDFIDTLTNKLEFEKQSKIWDLACGRGRHSIYLNSKGFEVTGTDLSENSIEEALSSGNKHLDFFVHDMREPFRVNYFDYVLNLFTSIGYFENKYDNTKVFRNVNSALKPNGVFVIDFFNSQKVISQMLPQESKLIDGIQFDIFKKIQNDKIVKRIEFVANGKPYFFEEKVSLFKLQDFNKLANKTGFKLTEAYGNYNLSEFDIISSDRLIMFFKK